MPSRPSLCCAGGAGPSSGGPGMITWPSPRPNAEVSVGVAHRSSPAGEWAARLDTTSDGGPGWRDYLDEMYQHVWSKDFWAKEVYLGVRLGQRGMRAQLSGGVFSQFINAYRTSEQALGINDEAISSSEIARWTEQAERLGP